jgi:transcriptional regulator with XRE-family HTH domain
MAKAYLSTQLRTHRKRAYLTQTEVAILIAVLSGTTVSRHEAGDRRISLEDAFAYEALFGIPASALFPGAYEKAREGVSARALGLLGKLSRDGPDTPAARHKQRFLESVLRRLRS